MISPKTSPMSDSPGMFPFGDSGNRTWTSHQVPRRVKLLAFGVPLYLVLIHLWTWSLTAPLALAGRADFRQFYVAGAIVRSGHSHQLYEYAIQKHFQDNLVSSEPTALPFVSPAYHALIFLPFSVIPYRAAYLVFLPCNIAALTVCFILLWPWMQNLRCVYPWLPLAIFLGFLPLAYALIQGQDSVLLTTLLAAAFVLLVRARNFYAGVLAGLGLFKFPIVLPIAILFLIWRRWTFFFGFAVSASTLTAFSVALTGLTQAKLYVASLLSIAGLRSPVSDLSRYPITLKQMANAHGFVFGIVSGWMPKPWLQAVTILLSIAVLVWTARKGWNVTESSALLLLAIPCSILVGHHTYIHDLSVLLLPLVVLLNSFLPGEGRDFKNARFINRAAALMFVVPLVESFSPDRFSFVAIPVLLLLVALAAALDSHSAAKAEAF